MESEALLEGETKVKKTEYYENGAIYSEFMHGRVLGKKNKYFGDSQLENEKMYKSGKKKGMEFSYY